MARCMYSLFNQFLVHKIVINIFYPDLIKYKINYSGVIELYASKLCSTSKRQLENIHSQILDVWGYLMTMKGL